MLLLCKNPIHVPSVEFPVDCGHCYACRLKRRSEWAMRIEHECALLGHNCLFVTLTYSNEHLNKNFSISKRDIQLFLKRLRKKISESDDDGRKFKYFIAGEYGETTHRPHYHAIFMGLPPYYEDVIFEAWGKCDRSGYKCEIPKNGEAYSYVAGYCSKKLGTGYDKKFRQKYRREPEFQLVSKGIGKDWALKFSDRYKEDGTMLVKGKERVIPRYYRKILDIKYAEHDRLQEVIRQKLDDTAKAVAKTFKDVEIEESKLKNFHHYNMYGSHRVDIEFSKKLYEMRQECNRRLEARHKEWRDKI